MTASLRRRALLLASFAAPLAGCSVIPTFHPEVRRGTAVPADHVLVVGRIDLIPPLRADDQKIRVGTIDPFDTASKLRNRAVIFLADTPVKERRQTASVMNPVLGEWFVVALPRSQRHVADAAVFMEYEPQLQGRRQATVETAQLVLPALFAFDFRSTDQAVYIGSWRVWRDEFHAVTRLEIVDESAAARSALARQVGTVTAMRAVLPDIAPRTGRHPDPSRPAPGRPSGASEAGRVSAVDHGRANVRPAT